MSKKILPVAFLALFAFGAWLSAEPTPHANFTFPVHPQGVPEPGTFPAEWIAGNNCDTDPAIQVHAYNDDFYILRQSKCNHFEGPFMYLIFGEERALLLDTGSINNPPVAEVVCGVVRQWQADNDIYPYELVVAHSHGHFDHIANDSQFIGLDNVTVVGVGIEEVRDFFGIDNWPHQVVSYDLGNRLIDIIPTPGHLFNCITIYDPRTQILLTGDMLYPGFIFLFQPDTWDTFSASVGRLVLYTAQNPVEWILGCHIEISDTPGVLYPYGTPAHPDERELQLDRSHLLELNDAVKLGPANTVLADFAIDPFWIP